MRRRLCGGSGGAPSGAGAPILPPSPPAGPGALDGSCLGGVDVRLQPGHVALLALELLQQRLQLLAGSLELARLAVLRRLEAVAHLLHEVLPPLALGETSGGWG